MANADCLGALVAVGAGSAAVGRANEPFGQTSEKLGGEFHCQLPQNGDCGMRVELNKGIRALCIEICKLLIGIFCRKDDIFAQIFYFSTLFHTC